MMKMSNMEFNYLNHSLEMGRELEKDRILDLSRNFVRALNNSKDKLLIFRLLSNFYPEEYFTDINFA